MFCPRCGTENDEGSRYCVSCGSDLPAKTPTPDRSDAPKEEGFKAGLNRFVGTTKRTRMVTIGTAIALLVAIAAFIALSPADEGSSVPQDALTKALDARCVQHKAEIAAAQRRALTTGTLVALSRYGDSMVPIAGEWRTELRRAEVPPDRTELVAGLSTALLEVEIEAGTLGRAARESRRAELSTAAARVDVATSNVEAAINSLELERCGRLQISQGRLIRQ
jgi:hypothetical protein